MQAVMKSVTDFLREEAEIFIEIEFVRLAIRYVVLLRKHTHLQNMFVLFYHKNWNRNIMLKKILKV